jgi:hypothetical protein
LLEYANSLSFPATVTDDGGKWGFPGGAQSPTYFGHVVAYLPGAFPARTAGRLHPPLSASPRRPPAAGPGPLHEVKHDGYRIVARKQGERVLVDLPNAR